jgi:hypothetical protein
MTRTLLRLGAAALLAACGRTPGDLGPSAQLSEAALLGRWEKLEKSLPPITLELRRSTTSFTGIEGQIWLSGMTYTLPATIVDTNVVLADPVSSGPAPFVAVYRDGALRVRLNGHDREERLVRRNLND